MFAALKAIFPVFFTLAVGTLLRYRKIVRFDTFNGLNKLVFNLLLPCTIFANILKFDKDIGQSLQMIVFSISTLTVLLLLMGLVCRHSRLDANKKGVIVQATVRSNFILLGLPILGNLYADTTSVSLLIAALAPFLNIFSVISFALFADVKVSYGSIIMTTIKNPLMIATFAAVSLRALGIEMPRLLFGPIESFGQAATPISLLMLGGILNMEKLDANIGVLLLTSLNKLIIIPTVFIALAGILGFRGIDLAAMVILFGGPAAVATFSIAKEMKGDAELAAQIVMVTTLFSVITLPIFITVLNALNIA